jgi:hypothetical protein
MKRYIGYIFLRVLICAYIIYALVSCLNGNSWVYTTGRDEGQREK